MCNLSPAPLKISHTNEHCTQITQLNPHIHVLKSHTDLTDALQVELKKLYRFPGFLSGTVSPGS